MEKQRKKGLPLYKGARRVYSLLILLIIGETLAVIAQAFFLARAITFLFQRMPIGDVIADIGFFFVAFVLRYILEHMERFVAERYAAVSINRLRNEMVERFFQNGFLTSGKMGTGHLVTLAMEGVDHVRKYIEIIGIRTFKSVIMPVMIAIFVFFYDKISALILIGTVPIVIIFMILLGMAAEKMADKQFSTYTRLSNHFIDSLRGLETLAYLGKSRSHAKKIEQVSDDYRKATMKTLRVAFLSSFALDFFTSLAIAFVAVGLGLRLIDGHITLLPALTILILAPEYFSPIKQVGKDYHATLDGQIAMSEIERLITGIVTVSNPNNQQILWEKDTSLQFENVTVKIDEKKWLHNITLEVKNGWIGIIGSSGSGKSTLINVLSGRLQPTAGTIKINKQRACLMDEAWFKHIAYIPQHPYIFPISLADNIRFYAPSASDDSVLAIVEKIGMKQFVSTLPNGIYEKIGEGGRTLSGGQEQRIAIARALLSEKPIILLDEPTAHLDIETEYEIKQLMLSLFKDQLVFLATHRLHWMKEMDHIYVLEHGYLVEQGTHRELIKKRGNY